MKAIKISALTLPVALFVVVIVASFAVVRYSEALVAESDQRLKVQRQALAAATQKHSNAGLEKQILTQFRETYDALGKVGFVGAEQRINWVDSLRAANREARLFGVEYRIGQQEAYPYTLDLAVGDLPMRQSVMKLKMPLLHEGDLMPFFRALASRSAGVFTMNTCTLTRSADTARPGERPNLNAECDLAWISVPEVESGAAKP